MNDEMPIIDETLMEDDMPIGTIITYIPLNPNYLPCDGRHVVLDMYKDLFNVLSSQNDVMVRTEVIQCGEQLDYVKVFSLPDFRDSKGVYAWIKAKQ